MAQDLGMANAASKLADKIKKDVENTINIAKDQKRSGSAVASIEKASKDITQYTKMALTDIEYTCDELTSDGKYYYHYCVVQVPKSSIFKKTGSNDQAMDLLLFFSVSLFAQSSGPEWLDSEYRKSNYSSNKYLVGFAKKELNSKKNKSKVLKSLRSQAESKMLDNFFTDISKSVNIEKGQNRVGSEVSSRE